MHDTSRGPVTRVAHLAATTQRAAVPRSNLTQRSTQPLSSPHSGEEPLQPRGTRPTCEGGPRTEASAETSVASGHQVLVECLSTRRSLSCGSARGLTPGGRGLVALVPGGSSLGAERTAALALGTWKRTSAPGGRFLLAGQVLPSGEAAAGSRGVAGRHLSVRCPRHARRLAPGTGTRYGKGDSTA